MPRDSEYEHKKYWLKQNKTKSYEQMKLKQKPTGIEKIKSSNVLYCMWPTRDLMPMQAF